jgi:hypothetical protein
MESFIVGHELLAKHFILARRDPEEKYMSVKRDPCESFMVWPSVAYMKFDVLIRGGMICLCN